MKMNGESIHGTEASPFKSLAWGRATQKAVAGGTRLYLHVFDWPKDGALIVPGLLSDPKRAYLLSDAARKPLAWSRAEDSIELKLPAFDAPDPDDNVIVLELAGRPDVSDPPTIRAEAGIFIDALDVTITSDRAGVEVRYTTDGTVPVAGSPLVKNPVRLTASGVVTARAFRGGKPVSGPAREEFKKVVPRQAAKDADTKPGLKVAYYEGAWDKLPDFSKLRAKSTGVAPLVDLKAKQAPEHYGLAFSGFLRVPKDGVYTLFVSSDDGSRLYLGDTLVVDNDGLHGQSEASGLAALSAGLHPIRIIYFNATGGEGLIVSWQGPGLAKQAVPAAALAHRD